MFASEDTQHCLPRLSDTHFVRTELVQRMIQGVVRSVFVAAMGHGSRMRTQYYEIVEWAFIPA